MVNTLILEICWNVDYSQGVGKLLNCKSDKAMLGVTNKKWQKKKQINEWKRERKRIREKNVTTNETIELKKNQRRSRFTCKACRNGVSLRTDCETSANTESFADLKTHSGID